MTPHFNLATDPFAFPRDLSGAARDPVGLEALVRDAHRYADAELTLPPATSGLYRILAYIGARVAELDQYDDEDDWAERRNELLEAGRFDADAVAQYFDTHRDSFSLFGPRPWGQDARLDEQSPKHSGVNKLVWGRPAGNTQVWWSHTSDTQLRPLPAMEAAHHLIATLYYGASGRCTSRTASGVTAANTSAGPLRSALSLHPVGRTLFETIVLNIPFTAEEGEPAFWERGEPRDPTLPPDRGVGLSGILVNKIRHAVRLYPEEGDDGSIQVADATVTWGARSDGGTVQAPDPFQIYATNKDGGQYAVPADAERALWRDVDAILQDSEFRGGPTKRPALMEHLPTVPLALRRHVRLRAFGFDQDGQARDRIWWASATPPVLEWLVDEPAAQGNPAEAEQTLARIKAASAAAERSGWRLRNALIRTWKDSGLGRPVKKGDDALWTAPGLARYWPAAEEAFWNAAHGTSTDPNAFITASLRAYDAVTEDYRDRPRVARAAARHRSFLYAGWIAGESGTDDHGTEDAA